jgi:hypothetical protein
MARNHEQEQQLHAGSVMPDLQGEFLTGRKARLPEAGRGKISLVAIGFTYESRFAVEAWVKRYREAYGEDPQFTFFEVPMIGGMARLGKWFIDSGMRKGTPKQQHENVITVYGGVDPWKNRLGHQDPKAAYLLLLDQQGKVIWRHAAQQVAEGAFDRLQRAATTAVSQQQPVPAVQR